MAKSFKSQMPEETCVYLPDTSKVFPGNEAAGGKEADQRRHEVEEAGPVLGQAAHIQGGVKLGQHHLQGRVRLGMLFSSLPAWNQSGGSWS